MDELRLIPAAEAHLSFGRFEDDQGFWVWA